MTGTPGGVRSWISIGALKFPSENIFAMCPRCFLIWTCIDSTTGEDLAEEVRGYYIPDFSNWKSHDEMERAFARLPADLQGERVRDHWSSVRKW